MAEFYNVAAASDIPPGKMKRFVVDEVPVAVYNCGGAFTATHDTCTHAEASLSEGFLDCRAGTVECPLHGAHFDIRSGKALSLPAITPVKTFEVKLEDGALFIRV